MNQDHAIVIMVSEKRHLSSLSHDVDLQERSMKIDSFLRCTFSISLISNCLNNVKNRKLLISASYLTFPKFYCNVTANSNNLLNNYQVGKLYVFCGHLSEFHTPFCKFRR